MTLLRFVRRLLVPALAVAIGGVAAAPPALAQSPLDVARTSLWPAWRTAFVDASGRIVDNANGSISHSEGQGYGLLLAYLAGDVATFRQIWAWTDQQLYIRDDGLAAWKWEPAASPHITDLNNATDGDLLIAYALALAGTAWADTGLVQSATRIARAVGTTAVADADGRTVFLPGVSGFTAADRDDGPVVNLSYWVFEALPVLASVAPEIAWETLASSGIELIARSATGVTSLPPEWTALGDGSVRPAAGFDMVYGYNAIRIPLYLLRANLASSANVEPFLRNRDASGASAVVHLSNGTPLEPLSDQGYRMALATVDCAVNGVPLRADLKPFETILYYPSTLYLLSWFYLAERHPECL